MSKHHHHHHGDNVVDFNDLESFSFLHRMLPNSSVHVLDTIFYHNGSPFQIIENSRGIEKGTVVTHTATDMSALDVLKFFKQRSHELVGFKRKDGRLRDVIARVWVLETSTTIISTTMNENALRSFLTDSSDSIVAIQAFMGGWPARASGKFEHKYNIRYDTKKVLHETFELVNAVGGTGDLNGVEITVYTKEADRLAIMTGFQHECISKLTSDFVKHIQHRTGAGISSIVLHVEFDSAWHPHVVAARSIYFVNAPAEFVIMKDSMIYPAGKSPAHGNQGQGKSIKRQPERKTINSGRRISTIGLVRGRGTFNNKGNAGLLNIMQSQGTSLESPKGILTTLLDDDSSSSSSSSSPSSPLHDENTISSPKDDFNVLSLSPPTSPINSHINSPINSPVSTVKKIAPTFDENYDDDKNEIPSISASSGPKNRIRPLSSSMSRVNDLHLYSTVTGGEFPEGKIEPKNRYLSLTESQRIRMSYNASMIKMQDIGPFEPQITKKVRPLSAPGGHHKKEKLGIHGLERGGKRSSGFWKRLERPNATRCWGDLCFLSDKAQFHHHTHEGKHTDLVTMRSIAYLRAEMKFLGGTFGGDEVDKAANIFNLKRDNLVSYLGRAHLESIGEKVRSEILRLHFGTLALTEMRNWDNIHSQYRNWIYGNLVMSLGLNKKSFYYTVPVCHCCMKLYTFLDTFRDEIVQYDIWPENKKKRQSKNNSTESSINGKNNEDVDVVNTLDDSSSNTILEIPKETRARSPSIRVPPSPNPLEFIEEEENEDLEPNDIDNDDFVLSLDAKTDSLEISNNFNSLEISNNFNSLEMSIKLNSDYNNNNATSTHNSRQIAREKAKRPQIAVSEPPSEGQILKARLRGRTELTLSAWTNLYDRKYMNKRSTAEVKNKKKTKPKVEAPPPMTLREKVNEISRIYEQKSKKNARKSKELRPVNRKIDNYNLNEQQRYYDDNDNNDNHNIQYYDNQYNDNRYDDNINYENSYINNDNDHNDDDEYDNNDENDTSINDYITYHTHNNTNTYIQNDSTLDFGPTIVHALPQRI